MDKSGGMGLEINKSEGKERRDKRGGFRVVSKVI